MRPGRTVTALVVLLPVLQGCATRAQRYDVPLVSAELEARTGHGTAPAPRDGEPALPGGVDLEDGLTEGEAVATALWNNAPFQEILAELGLARADLIQADLLANPVLSVLFPVGPKQLEFATMLPLEALVLRPGRVAVAELDAERIAALLVENGLDLIANVRGAHADLHLARQKHFHAVEAARLGDEIAGFYQTRLRNGDVSELEAGLSRIEAMMAHREAARLARDVDVARERLADLIGLGEKLPELELEVLPPDRLPADSGEGDVPDARRLVRIALAARPDLRAAELAIEAAGERAGLARWEFLSIAAGVDANEEGKSDFEIGPAADVEIPIFDWNQGGRARATARLEQATRHYVTVRRRIVLEVREARARYLQAREELETERRDIIPALEEALRQAESAQAAGATSPLPVLTTRQRLLEARTRESELAAASRRARARLERGVGQQLDGDSMTVLTRTGRN